MKKIICMVLCIVMVLSLSACGLLGGKSDTKDPTTNNTQTENPTENPTGSVENLGEDYRENSVEWVAQQFIASLIKADYKAALRHFAVPAETPYFTEADVEWYLPRSNYAEVMDVNYAEYTVTVDKGNSTADTANCTVIVADKASEKTKTFDLYLTLDKNNKWGVKDNNFYLDEYYVVAPGGEAKLTVNGVDATDDYDSKFGTSQYQYLYKLTFVGKSEKTLAVSHKNFATDEEKVYPTANTAEEPLKLVVEYDDEAALTAMKELWMEFYQAQVDGKSYSDMIHLLSPSADPALAQGVMSGISGMLDNGDRKDFAITKMWYAAQKEGQQTKWLASDKLQIAFNYDMTWMQAGLIGGFSPKDQTYWDVVVLHYDGEKFTLDRNTQNHIFTEANEYTDKTI